MSDFTDLHVVITGGTGELGRAVVALLLEAGAICHIPSRRLDGLERLPFSNHSRARIEAGVDPGDERQMEAYYRALPGLYASIHLAGGFAMTPIEDADEKALQQMLRANLFTAYHCARASIRYIRKHSSETGGRIVNVAARPALEPRTGGGLVAYTVAKAGVAALTQALAQEVVGEDILVNAIAPSVIDTQVNRTAMPQAQVERWPSPKAIASSIVFLASPENQVTRGAVQEVYGRS